MKIEVQDASAKRYDVEAPDDTPLDKVVASATKSLGREVRVVDPPTKGRYALESAKKGFSEGVGTLALPADKPLPGLMGAPWYAAEYARKRFGAPKKAEDEKPVHTAAAEAVQRAIGYKATPAPSTASEWLIGKPAEFLGASAVPSAATVARSSRPVLAAATELFSNYFGGVGAKAGEEGGGALGKSAVKVSGGGKEAQEEGERTGRGVGGVVAGLGFGGGTAMAVPRAGGAVVEWVRKGLIPKRKDEGEIEKVASSLFTKHFRDSLISHPRYKPNLEQALATRAAIP